MCSIYIGSMLSKLVFWLFTDPYVRGLMFLFSLKERIVNSEKCSFFY